MIHATPAQAIVAPNGNSVLILDPSVTGGIGSLEAVQAAAAGFTPVVVNAAAWAATTAAEFATYRAIVLGDPTCVVGTAPITAAEANRAVWSPAIDGNVIIIGTDPTYHSSSQPGAVTLENRGIAFAGAQPTRTGAYICLSCYYALSPSGTPVPVLDQFGAFTVVGQGGCPANSHIIAVHPALVGLTDAALSNWGCSAHEGFQTWPASFDPLVISVDIPSTFVAPDSTTGAPYIMARGATLVSDICVTPDTATNVIGTPHTICAFVNNMLDCSGTGIPGVYVCASVVSGPCDSLVLGCGYTDSTGRICFTYTCYSVGTDVIEVSFVDATGRVHFQKVTKHWIEKPTATLIGEFTGEAGPETAELEYTLPDEGGLVGVNVYRAVGSSPDYVRLTDSPILVNGTGRYHYTDRALSEGMAYSYSLGLVEVGGREVKLGLLTLKTTRTEFTLGRPLPNPTRLGFVISATTPRDGQARLNIFDVRGRLVSVLHDGFLQAGAHSFAWNGRTQAGHMANSGMYFVVFESAGHRSTTRAVVMK